MSGWENRLSRATQLLSGSTPYPAEELAIAAESFYKKLVAGDAYKPSGTYSGPVTLVKATDNYVSLGKDYGLSAVSYTSPLSEDSNTLMVEGSKE